MFINMKQMVITIISIFLALGIGILIGFQVDSQNIIFEQQENLIENMENKFNELNKKNADLENTIKELQYTNKNYENYMNNIFSDYVKNKLKGLNIAIIETSGDYVYTNMRNAPKMAGANITSVTLLTDKIISASDEEKAEIMNYFGVNNKNIAPTVVKKIAEAVAGNGKFEDIKFLQEKEFIQIAGDFDVSPDFVIIAGGSKDNNNKWEIIDIPLIKELKKQYINVIGVENSDVANSYMDYYKSQKISTIDNVDTIIGQTSLVLVMTGKEGNFGIKKSAQSLMPFMNEEER